MSKLEKFTHIRKFHGVTLFVRTPFIETNQSKLIRTEWKNQSFDEPSLHYPAAPLNTFDNIQNASLKNSWNGPSKKHTNPLQILNSKKKYCPVVSGSATD